MQSPWFEHSGVPGHVASEQVFEIHPSIQSHDGVCGENPMHCPFPEQSFKEVQCGILKMKNITQLEGGSLEISITVT